MVMLGAGLCGWLFVLCKLWRAGSRHQPRSDSYLTIFTMFVLRRLIWFGTFLGMVGAVAGSFFLYFDYRRYDTITGLDKLPLDIYTTSDWYAAKADAMFNYLAVVAAGLIAIFIMMWLRWLNKPRKLLCMTVVVVTATSLVLIPSVVATVAS